MKKLKLSDLHFKDYGTSNAITPWERVRVANQVAFDTANDPNIRRLAGKILKGVPDIPRNGSKKVTDWIRKNFTYLQESPGVELLQGPYTTLYAGVVDCDDAAILYTALTRAAGIRSFFVGVGKKDEAQDLVHAVGFDSGLNRMFEVIDDSNYTGWKPSKCFRLPRGYFGVYHSDEPGSVGWYTDMDGSGFRRYNKGDDMACFTSSSMGRKVSTAPTAGEQASDSESGDWLHDLFGFGGTVAEGLLDVWEASETPATVVVDDGDWRDEYEFVEDDDGIGDISMGWIALGVVTAGGLIYALTRG